jgi:hypothetical protein
MGKINEALGKYKVEEKKRIFGSNFVEKKLKDLTSRYKKDFGDTFPKEELEKYLEIFVKIVEGFSKRLGSGEQVPVWMTNEPKLYEEVLRLREGVLNYTFFYRSNTRQRVSLGDLDVLFFMFNFSPKSKDPHKLRIDIKDPRGTSDFNFVDFSDTNFKVATKALLDVYKKHSKTRGKISLPKSKKRTKNSPAVLNFSELKGSVAALVAKDLILVGDKIRVLIDVDLKFKTNPSFWNLFTFEFTVRREWKATRMGVDGREKIWHSRWDGLFSTTQLDDWISNSKKILGNRV